MPTNAELMQPAEDRGSESRRILCTGGSGFIGSHLIDFLLTTPNTVILNIDIARPVTAAHRAIWRDVDILDSALLRNTVREFKPTHVVHLAARADMEGTTLDDYRANTEGTKNLLEACSSTNSIQRVIVTSSQHVRKPGALPAMSAEDFVPYKAYGASKAITEELTRQLTVPFVWTIVRPTTIWGPGSTIMANGLWRLLAARRYFHPRRDDVVRSYGYVKNVVAQLNAVMTLPADRVDRQVFYVGDACLRQEEWVNAFSVALSGRRALRAPNALLFAVAVLGEAFKRVGLPAPLFWSRYKNMVTSNPVPIEHSLRIIGEGPYSLKEGIAETVAWLRSRTDDA